VSGVDPRIGEEGSVGGIREGASRGGKNEAGSGRLISKNQAGVVGMASGGCQNFKRRVSPGFKIGR